MRGQVERLAPVLFSGDNPGMADRERGVALILVTFIVALATIIVVSLTYNTYMAARSNMVAERSLQAEYLLKSLLNFARVLIKEDTTEESSAKDPWGRFAGGQNLEPSLLGFDIPGLQMQLEINAEDAKVPVPALMLTTVNSDPDLKWRNVIECLFRDLGFDNDQQEIWKQKPFEGRFFNAQQMTANLIDYMDPNSESYEVQGFEKGVEGELNEKDQDIFRNSAMLELDELAKIPGFTPSRLRKVLPYMTTHGAKTRVNVNLAPRRILKCLNSGMTEAAADKIIAFRESAEGPFTRENIAAEMQKILDESTWSAISLMVNAGPQNESPHFQVLAKVDYGAATFFMRAYVYRWNAGELPVIYSVEIF